MKRRPFELLVPDVLNFGSLPIYETDYNTPILYIDKVNDKLVVKKKENINRIRLPLIDLENDRWLYTPHWCTIPSLVNEAINELVYASTEFAIKLTAKSYLEAHRFNQAGMFATKTDPIIEENDNPTRDALYDAERRIIIAPKLPENTYIFYPDSENLGVFVISDNRLKFGAAILNTQSIILVNDNKTEGSCCQKCNTINEYVNKVSYICYNCRS